VPKLLPLLLIWTALLTSGCVGARPDVLPEMTAAHQIAESTRLVVLVEVDDAPPGTFVRKTITYPAGAWIHVRADTPLPILKESKP
jgi:hypothetical protein